MFSKLLLGKSQRFEDFGSPQLFPALALLVAWVIVGACIIRGVKTSGKVRYLCLKLVFVMIECILGGLCDRYFSVFSSPCVNYSKCKVEWCHRWN